MPKLDYLAQLRQADWLVAVSAQAFPGSLPGKLYEYWAAGWAPILLIGGSGAGPRFVAEHEPGRTVAHGDVAAVEAILERLVDAWRRGAPVHISARGCERYDRREQAAVLAAAFRAVMAQANGRDRDGSDPATTGYRHGNGLPAGF